jgi:hypothetical protein
MRTRNALARLAVAGRPLLAEADSLVDAGEEDRILEQILGSDRPAVHAARRRRMTLVLVGLAVLVAAGTVASIEAGHGNRAVTGRAGHHHLALKGARIELAGYKFRTPTGFKASSTPCGTAQSYSNAHPVLNGFVAAASADGGCVEAAYLLGGNQADIPSDAVPADVGNYHGYFVSQGSSTASTLYVELPNAAGDGRLAYLVLFAKGLTQDQLIAVAESGLPTLPLRPTTTTGTESGG